jgi:glucose/arabinose dehydrogenase
VHRFPGLLPLLLAVTIRAEASAIADLRPLILNLDRPVQVVSAQDGSGNLYVAEQVGRIRLVQDAASLVFLDLSHRVSCCENGGLLSLVFHPEYEQNGELFIQYVNRGGDTVVSRFRRSRENAKAADPSSEEILILVPQPKDNVPNHHGGTLQFGPDGYLYISIGDGGANVVTRRAQELDHLLGKLLRIDVDGSAPYAIPFDNPYLDVPGARPEIWAIGLRNPWRFSFDDGDLFLGDVGHDSWEELNVMSLADSRGANFGWPIIEGAHCFPPGARCSASGLILPTFEYSRTDGCSVTAGFRYRGTRLEGLRDAYLYGDLCSGSIWALRESDGVWSTTLVLDTELMIVSFGEAEDSEPYVVDYNGTVFSLNVEGGRRRAVRH